MKKPSSLSYFTEITGYVRNDYVIAKVYSGKDSNLSHYIIRDKTYVGTVDFDVIYSEQKKKY